MCAIVDLNTIGELLKQKHDAAKGFYQWLMDQGTLVVGGKELRKAIYERHDDKQKQIVIELKSAGKILEINDSTVEEEERSVKLSKKEEFASNDVHIIALARISRARLLYSNDYDLHKDFKNPKLIDNPRGKVYSTLRDTGFSKDRRERLQRHVCNVGN